MAAALFPTKQHCCWVDRLSYTPVAQGEKVRSLRALSCIEGRAGFLSQKQGMPTQAKERIGRLTHLRALRQLMLPDFGSNGRANGISKLTN
ncbi:hypothetical protein [Bradyrhizobium sp. ARR65]|uniref:hypothetical protein n=1 Tax=Bradyrhizobium sp. ARR65 TaxID=1040989 RepID=UPI0012F96114|nr:hypothetical protein [Bradyrhizobium sp. ARR65]